MMSNEATIVIVIGHSSIVGDLIACNFWELF